MDTGKMDIIERIVNLIKKLTETGTGWFILFLALMITFGVIIFSKNNQEIQTLKTEKQEIQKLNDELIAQKLRMADECVDFLRKYASIFNEMGSHFAGNVNMFQTVERQTNAALQMQNSIINNQISQ